MFPSETVTVSKDIWQLPCERVSGRARVFFFGGERERERERENRQIFVLRIVSQNLALSQHRKEK
jgi:hypothetical protein